MMIRVRRHVGTVMTTVVVGTLLFAHPMNLYSQDFDAVQKRLGEAVAAGELTLEQANRMMQVLRHSAQSEREAIERRFKQIATKIEAAVEAGKLTREEAERKLIAVRRKLVSFTDADDDRRPHWNDLKDRFQKLERHIEEAVAAGKLSKEEAEKKLIAAKEKMFGRPDDHHDASKLKKLEYQQFEREIKSAVDAGKISAEDARRKLELFRQKMFGKSIEREADRAQRRMKYERLSEEIEKALDRGKLTEEQAKEKLEYLRRELLESR